MNIWIKYVEASLGRAQLTGAFEKKKYTLCLRFLLLHCYNIEAPQTVFCAIFLNCCLFQDESI